MTYRLVTPLSVPSALRRDVERLMDDVFPTATRHWTPAVDIEETDSAYHLTMDVPGLDAADLEVTAEGRTLTIRGRRAATGIEGGIPRRQERATGEFTRRFHLPAGIDAGAISAQARLGVLTIMVGKPVQARAQRIPVHGNGSGDGR
jgi:HSP20 family protein